MFRIVLGEIRIFHLDIVYQTARILISDLGALVLENSRFEVPCLCLAAVCLSGVHVTLAHGCRRRRKSA